ncbi:hypothetical protein QQP08_013953 [Theobroma cacao]|nr:hypothetical protein QQP08_012272 [Theobroma cacao]WRX21466.1 hypothetical protein QQP08_013953 [Theobroma cacao]
MERKVKHTLPKPAEVRCNPCARNPWKQVASTRAKTAMASQAVSPEGEGLPFDLANATNSNPAGIKRKAATKKGPVLGNTSFIATIAVILKRVELAWTSWDSFKVFEDWVREEELWEDDGNDHDKEEEEEEILLLLYKEKGGEEGKVQQQQPPIFPMR